MDITIDYYKELDIDRSWDEKTIREHLKNMEKIWIQRQGATNDKEQSLLIDKIIDNIRDARRYLIKAAKRQVYDQALELAYQAGRIVDVAEENFGQYLIRQEHTIVKVILNWLLNLQKRQLPEK